MTKSEFPMTNKYQKGTSLLEVLLYIALLAVIMLPIAYLIPAISEAKTKNIAISEVDQQGLQISRIITQTVRNAKNITSPVLGASANQLTLETDPITPTIFDISNETLEIKENGVVTGLTSPQVLVSSLSFFNYSAPDTPGIIRFQFTLSYKNNLGRQEYNYSKTFLGSASLKQ